jgi:hypothetical protein
LVVGEQDALLPDVLLEHLVLGSQVVVRLLLFAIDPTCEYCKRELSRLKDGLPELTTVR